MMEERLNKIIAHAGICSRRLADELIEAGEVQVNGKTVRGLGAKADPQRDHIRVQGKLLKMAEQKKQTVTIMLNKPAGYVSTTSDPEGRPTVLDLVPAKGRLYPVGRLDYDTTGLLLLTNDGELAHELTHPSSMIPKTYVAKVEGIPDYSALSKLRRGVMLDRKPAAPAKVRIIEKAKDKTHAWLSITLIEGRNREVRRMCEKVGHPVSKLKRVALGPLLLTDLLPGKFRHLDGAEIKRLKDAVRGRRGLKRKNK